ncbi:MAG: protein TolR [bacterium]|nr:protein TolR [bacterium]
MAFKNSSNSEHSTLAEINVVPLVDIMLVLLVIFMVTAPFLNESIDVDLPEVTAASASTEKKDKIITVNKQGQVFIEGEDKTPYDMESLGPALKNLFAEDTSTEKTLFLRADKTVPYGTVVKIMALAKQVGIARIGMITEPEQS